MFFFLLLRIIAVSSCTTSFPSQWRAFVPPWPNLTSESDQSSVDCCKMPSLQLLNCWTCLIKRWKYNPHERRCSPGWSVCVCLRTCVRRARACVCTCTARSKTDKKNTLWASVRPNDQIHTKHVKTAGLESIHLNTVYVLKWTRTVERKLCVSIFCLSDRLLNQC